MSPPLAPPGQFWEVNGCRLHAQLHPPATRTSSPTVVMDAALGGSSLSWLFVERRVREFAPTLAYDRAGLGWSDPGPMPRGLPHLVAELRQLLQQASRPPYLLVGHSFGALVVRQYTAQFPAEVVGLVLVDPPALGVWSHPDAEHRARLESGIRLCRRGALASRCGLAQFCAWLISIGALRLAARYATVVSGGKLRKPSDFNFTPAVLLPDDCKPVMRWFWTRPRLYEALAGQMAALPAAARLVAQVPALDNLPLAVLSAADTPAPQLEEHDLLARQSARGTHLQAHASGHWIPLEEPELVIDAIRAVYDQTAKIVYPEEQRT